VKRQWKKAQVVAGIARPIRWHDLRHECASLLIAAGKNPRYIAKQMGHADPVSDDRPIPDKYIGDPMAIPWGVRYAFFERENR